MFVFHGNPDSFHLTNLFRCSKNRTIHFDNKRQALTDNRGSHTRLVLKITRTSWIRQQQRYEINMLSMLIPHPIRRNQAPRASKTSPHHPLFTLHYRYRCRCSCRCRFKCRCTYEDIKQFHRTYFFRNG